MSEKSLSQLHKISIKSYTLAVLILLSIIPYLLFSQGKSLDFFLEQGLANSPLLKDLHNQINTQSIDSLLIIAQSKPYLGFNTSLYYAPIIKGYGYNDAVTNINTITSQLVLIKPIFDEFADNAQFARVRTKKESLKVNEKISQKDLKKIITSQYLSVCAIWSEIGVNKALLNSMNDEGEILKRLVEKGLYKQVDYLSFQVEQKNQELLLQDLDMQYRKEYSALNLLCGLQDTSYNELSMPEIKQITNQKIENSPLFIQFRMDSLRIQSEKTIIDANYKPLVFWTLDAGLLNVVPNDLKKNFGFSLGLTFTLPIYDGGQRGLNYQKLDIAEQTRKGYFDYFKSQYYMQLQELNDELTKTENILQSAKQQQKLLETIIEQNNNLLNSGAISIVDFIMSIRNYIAINYNINQYQIRRLQIINEINYLSEE
ncbi:MAG TPA: TolC family protein [Bacteroidota bacterium]|nr:TolC family protein [Bacteroidota bacterium]HRT67632.1 TolC family protein [Bacteroidota bacterium]